MFTILSDYAYGDAGSPPRIPGGATLTFEVELFEFEGEDISSEKDKSITRRIKTAGEGFDHPNVSTLSRYISFIKSPYLTTCVSGFEMTCTYRVYHIKMEETNWL